MSSPSSEPQPSVSQRAIFQRLELLLAEKRTSLSVVRTGIAVAALPLSILGLLVATSRLYAWSEVRALMLPLLVICVALFLFAVYLVVHGMRHVRAHDRRIEEIKRQDPELAALLE